MTATSFFGAGAKRVSLLGAAGVDGVPWAKARSAPTAAYARVVSAAARRRRPPRVGTIVIGYPPLRAADCSTGGVLYCGPRGFPRARLLPLPPQHVREVSSPVPLPLHRQDQAGRPGDRGLHGQPRPRGAGAPLPGSPHVEAA